MRDLLLLAAEASFTKFAPAWFLQEAVATPFYPLALSITCASSHGHQTSQTAARAQS